MRLVLLLALTFAAAALAAEQAPATAAPAAAGQVAEDPRPRLRAIAEAAQREQIALALAWLKGCDLVLPPAVELPADPRDSDRAAKREVDEAREKIAGARLVLERAVAKPDDVAAQRDVLALVQGGARGSFVEFYLRLQAGEPARTAVKKPGAPDLRD